MTRAQAQKKASVLRSELVKMSHQGWDKFKASDYQPMEAELRALDERLRR